MNERISDESISELNSSETSIHLVLNFWIDHECLDTQDEIDDMLEYCRSGSFGDWTDDITDILMGIIHAEFNDPPYGSPISQLPRPTGVMLDTGVTYD